MRAVFARLRGSAVAPSQKSPTDRQLLERFIELRDQAAFQALVERHGPIVYGVCCRILGNHHDAEDVFQATFLLLARKAAAIVERETPVNWLYRVAHFAALRAKAAIVKRRRREQQVQELPEPVRQHVWPELESLLDQELSRLPEKYRIPILLCDLEGQTVKEAARQLGWPPGTVATRLRRARAQLAKRLTRPGVALSAGALTGLPSQSGTSAAVPAELIASTVKTASVVAGGQTAPAGLVSAKVATLMKGISKAMLLAKLKIATALLLALSAAGLGLNFEAAKSKPANEVTLPPDVRAALEQNAKLLNPITVSYTAQLVSRLSVQETFERLKIAGYRSPHQWFEKTSFRTILQDQKFYAYSRFPAYAYFNQEGYREFVAVQEFSLDEKIFYHGGFNEGYVNPGILVKDLASRPAAQGIGLAFALKSPYSREGAANPGFAGFSFPSDARQTVSLRPESSVLALLRENGKLISVENVSLGNRQQVKVELVVDNAMKRRAESIDLEKLKEAYQEPRFSPEEREERLQNFVRQRNLPATKRFVYYLDPALHYAVRRWEEWSDPDALLVRYECSDFEQLPDRELWLPRRCEAEIHEFSTNAGVVYEESFLSEVVEVTELSGQPAPAEQFVLKYDKPGTYVEDRTLVESERIPEGAPISSPLKNGDWLRPDPELPRKQRSLEVPVPLFQGAVSYAVGNSPDETKRNREQAVRQALIVAKETPRAATPAVTNPSAGFRWILVGNGLVALFVASYLVYRRYAK